MAVCLLTAASARLLGRLPLVYPLVAALVGSVLADLLMLGILQLLGETPIGPIPVPLLGGAAGVNAALALVLIIPLRHLLAGRADGGHPRG